MELEFVPVRLHSPFGDDLGTAALPDGWTLEVGDLLVDEGDRLVHVLELVPVDPPARIAALVRVAPSSSGS